MKLRQACKIVNQVARGTCGLSREKQRKASIRVMRHCRFIKAKKKKEYSDTEIGFRCSMNFGPVVRVPRVVLYSSSF